MASQHGLFTRAQAIAVGYPPSSIQHRVATGQWEALDYGVYRATGVAGTWRQRLLAACLAGPAVASHRAAAALWHAPDAATAPIEVTAVRHRRRHQRTDVIWHESVRLEPYERRIIDAIPVTEPTRTLLDLASLGDDLLLATVYDDFIRRGLTSVPAILTRIDQLGALRRGVVAMRRLIKRRFPGATPESTPETSFDELIERAGLPRPVAQHEVRDEDGELIARVDFAYPTRRILIEIQSARWHDGQLEARRDRRRHARLAAMGYRVVPISAEDLQHRPDEVIATIRMALDRPA